MYARAVSCLYWPSMRDDILHTRAACSDCNLNAPSNPTPPPHPVHHPDYPFSDICSDFFEYSSKSYLVIVDRYSNWLSLFQLPSDNSSHLIKTLRNYCVTWGVARSLSSDGDSVFTSREMTDWLQRWDVQQRLSAAYYPRSNKRAEIAVKSGKRMIMSNVGPAGTLDTDRVASTPPAQKLSGSHHWPVTSPSCLWKNTEGSPIYTTRCPAFPPRVEDWC